MAHSPTRKCPPFSFFFNDTATTEIYTLSLHDALPISDLQPKKFRHPPLLPPSIRAARSEEHTSELQSLRHLVCRLLLEKKKRQEYLESTQRRDAFRVPCELCRGGR